MGGIELVIKMPEEMYKWVKDVNRVFYDYGISDFIDLVENGRPLPKGHGRLIDADHLKDVILLHNYHGNNKDIVPYADRKGYRLRQREVDEAIINAPTIIEGDKE